jgi:hypothetical protein
MWLSKWMKIQPTSDLSKLMKALMAIKQGEN